VAAGKMKFHGQWLPATEGMRLAQRERGEQLLQQGRRLISQGRLETATQRLQSVLSLSAQPDLVSQAKSLLASAFQQQIASLDRQRQQLEADISSAQQRVNQAQGAVNTAEGSRSQATGNGQSLGRPAPVGSYRPLGGDAPAFVQDQNSINTARNNLANEQGNLDQAKSQLNDVAQKLAAVRSQASTVEARWGIIPGNANSGIANARPTAASPAPVNSPDVLVGLTTWVHNNWIFMAAVGLVLLFVLSRIVKG
jgi:hypothetical protein